MSTPTKTLQSSFCKNIKDLRNERKWSREYLAHRLDMSVQSVYKIETGITNVTLSCLERVAEIYELPMADLLRKSNEQFKKTTDAPKSQLSALKQKLIARETEISDLQHKIIELYEELQHKNVPA